MPKRSLRGLRCPVCGRPAGVIRTRPKTLRVCRTRRCSDPHCRHTWHTVECHVADLPAVARLAAATGH